MRRTTGTGAVVALLCLLAGACTDPALVDRVADVEREQSDLRAAVADIDGSATDATTPDPLGDEVEALGTTVADLEERITVLDGELASLRDGTDANALSADERLTTIELQLGELRTSLTQLRDQASALADRASSLEVQLDSHADDPGAHTGAPASP